MKNIKLILEYDGTNYCGFQRQRSQITVQQCLEEAISSLTGEEVQLIGCSRTDSGVHAREFVANFKTLSSIPAERFKNAINTKLPEDIAIIKSEEAEEDFHARFSAKGKTYSYTILNQNNRSALYRNCSYHVKPFLDIEKMKSACEFFLGTHDFSAFKSSGGQTKSSVRTIKELTIKAEGSFIRIYVTGDGFLYNMVRIIAGTLIEVGQGRILPSDIEGIILSRDRTKAGRCAPPQGLILEKVYY